MNTENKSKTSNNEPYPSSLQMQLNILNERSRWYSSQLWQIPFAFLGIATLIIGTAINRDKPDNIIIAVSFLTIFAVGVAVIIHLRGLADGEKRAVLNIQNVEKQLHLEQTAKLNQNIWLPFKIVAIIVTIISFSFSIVFLKIGLKKQENTEIKNPITNQSSRPEPRHN
ncbi:MAG: hypothetical protein ABIC04_06990 [Nanoarchaeota archaeon]